MGLEPPPDVMRADRLRKQGIRGRMRTGAKTATKDQERDYLERFARLAEDPSPLVPRWAGSGADPFARMRRQLQKVSARRNSNFWLKWYGRGKQFHSAYAQTLLVLRGGKIPSFASLKLGGRDVKYVLRGRGLRDKLIAVQNHETPDARLLGFLDVVRKNRFVLVSLPDDFFAVPRGGPLPAGTLQRVFQDLDLPVSSMPEGVACPHAGERRPRIRYDLTDLGAKVTLCAHCIRGLDGFVDPHLEAYFLGPGGHLEVAREILGSELVPRPESTAPDLDALLAGASRAAIEKSKRYTDVHDTDYLAWTEEAFKERLDARPEGYLLVGQDLWLSAYEEAARTYAGDELERRALVASFRRRVPRLRAADATLNKLLEDAWETDAEAILREAGGALLAGADVSELARQRPSDALAALVRVRATEERFAGYPRFEGLAPPLRLAHDLFKAQKTGDSGLFQRRLADGVRDPALKPLALALARAFRQSAGVEWQYAPHEKDQALFWEPYGRELALATPESFVAVLSKLAEAAQAPAPVPKSVPA